MAPKKAEGRRWNVGASPLFDLLGNDQREHTAAMTRMRRSRVAGALALAAFLLAFGLAAAPQLHERLHPTSRAAEDTCAAALIASGNVEHSLTPTLSVKPRTVERPHISLTRPSAALRALFLITAVDEHAPPAA